MSEDLPSEEWSYPGTAPRPGGLHVPRYPCQRCTDPARPAAAGQADRRPGLAARPALPSATTCRGRRRSSGPTVIATWARPAWSTGPRAPHRQPNRTPTPVERKIVHLRWTQRLGPVQIGDRLGMPSSTVHAILVRCRLNRLTHIDRATGEPIRRYEHEQPGDMIHVDVKKLGKIPDGGGWRYVGRQQGEQEPRRDSGPHRLPQQAPQRADRDLLPPQRRRRLHPRGLRRAPRRRDQGDRGRGSAQRASPGSPTAASPSNGC